MPRSNKKKYKSQPPSHHARPKQPAKPVAAYSPRVQSEVQALFKKNFAFMKPDSGLVWALPLAETLFTAPVVKDWDPVLTGYKAELNDLKCKLSDKEIRTWHQHTSFTHRSALVIPHLRCNVWAELCTQAWCKFYEILSSYDIIQRGFYAKEAKPFTSVHLCEAPGAFVTSLNHFMKSHGRLRNLTWNWTATTLNPYYEGNSTDAMIADDRFILQTQDRWFFGDDNTGDLMNPDNLTSLRERLKTKSVQLVTADGSINCQNDPAEQEIVVSQLHYCEVITAMELLAAGGTFVLKMFTLYEHQTACLMYLLNCTFQQVHVCKPATSKSGNSEVYVVCLSFLGQQSVETYMPRLLSKFGPAESLQALFPASDIPSSFLSQLRNCTSIFKDYQMKTISQNISLYPTMSDEERHHLTQVREYCCQAYVEHYAVHSIRKQEKICSDMSKGKNTRAAMGMFSKTSTKRLHGTFFERHQQEIGHWIQRLSFEYDQLSIMEPGSEVITQTIQNVEELMPGEVSTWRVIIGKKLTSIQSSSFCLAESLDDWNLACTNSQVQSNDDDSEMEVVLRCDQQAALNLIQADRMTLSRISRGESGMVNCLCLLTEPHGDVFLQHLMKTEQWSFSDCLVTISSADLMVRMVEKSRTEQHHDDNQVTQSAMSVSPISVSHLGDQTVLKKCCDSLSHSKVAMVYADCSLGAKASLYHGKPGLAELDAKLQFLACTILAIHALSVGGTLMLSIPSLLTRLSAGLLYVIHKTFQKVTLIAAGGLIKPFKSPRIIILAQGIIRVHPALIEHLWTVYAAMLDVNDTKDVLQILPQSRLCEKEFNNSLSTFNGNFLEAVTSYLIKLELKRQDTSSIAQGPG
ncbi:cap-specific mRNA (nucleoside-2'-O-)-methyltransferase 2-like [Asterias amurensis]|uniref:cap-specific mRNA (nucleoside-2'-O-)-methyltransferase 2-like n=1 Tax=Asterias amurensis TaxID=7602 RepID=UPI003AB3507E